jgi:serine/threonine-protein kinase
VTGTDVRPRAARPRRARWFARQDWYFAFALALFVGTIVWFGRAIADFVSPASKSIGAPLFVGQTLADAFETAQRTRVKVMVVQRVPSDRYPKDVVIRQDPVAGAQVREGRQISLVVSTGVLIFAMPDLRYETLREVGLDLSHDRLVLGKVRTVPSDEVPANRVVTQDPPPLTSVRVGSVVNVDLSKGGPPALRVPSFTDMSIDEARRAATDDHIQIGQIVWTPFGRYGPERGIVVRQSPPFNAVIGPSQAVSLQVSAGPREAGYIIRQVHAVTTVPEDAAETAGKAPTVRVSITDETGTWNVYDAYAEPKQRLDFNLTVVGTAELDVYVNNELVDATKLGTEPKIQEHQEVGSPPAGSHQPNDVLNPNATPKPAATAAPAAAKTP